MVAHLQAKANPFRNGVALLRSARADRWFPRMRETMMRLLNRHTREAAQRARDGETEIVPDSLAAEWEQELLEEQRKLLFKMAEEGFIDAGQEFFGSKTMVGRWPKAPRFFKGKQRLDEFVTAEEANQPIIVTEQIGPDVDAKFLTEANFDQITAHLEQVASFQTKRSTAIIQRIFDAAQDEGILPKQIARRIEERGFGINRSRSEMIARTETIWSYNEGAQQRYASLGVQVKEWVVTRDDRLCPWCRTLDGVTVATDDAFFKGGDSLTVVDNGKSRTLTFSMDVFHPPLHPHCRCVLVPVLGAEPAQPIEAITPEQAPEEPSRPQDTEQPKLIEKPPESTPPRTVEWQKWRDGLDDETLKAYDTWSSVAFEDMRQVQRDGISDTTDALQGLFQTKSDLIQKSLENSPGYEGTVWRGMSDLPLDVLDEFIDAKVIEMDVITSASRLESVATDFAIAGDPSLGSIVMRIEQKSGTWISPMTRVKEEEDEVLLKRGTKYQVIDVDLGDEENRIEIVLREILGG